MFFSILKRLLSRLFGFEGSFIERIERGDVYYIMERGVPRVTPPPMPKPRSHPRYRWLAEGFEAGSLLLADPEALLYILISTEAIPDLRAPRVRGGGGELLAAVAGLSLRVGRPIYALAQLPGGSEARILAAGGLVTGVALETPRGSLVGSPALEEIVSMSVDAQPVPLAVRERLVEWRDERLSVFVRGLDNQHRYLVNTLNALFEGVVTGRGRSALETVVKRMVEYTKFHFRSEEILMEKYGYSEDRREMYERHVREHRGFVEATVKFKEEFEAGEKELTLDVFRFLANWLENHIAGTDRDYGFYFRSIGLANYEPPRHQALGASAVS